MDAFYLPLGEHTWRSTQHTVGPWGPDSQHAGPPAALLARAIERCEPRPDCMVGRMTVEILSAVPVADVEVTARVVRPGRSVELIEAVLRTDGRDVLRASAWRLRRTTGASARSTDPTPDALPPGATDELPVGWQHGYLTAMEWRHVRGGFSGPGAATVWARQRVPLVPNEEPSPLQRTLTVADSGNGASYVLDLRKWWFINTELTVHLHREPVGEWICLDAATAISDGGVGLAASTLSDRTGPFGRGAQSLLVQPR
jgi:hypothetical protein